MGDEVQAIKAGLLEVADLVVVNKGDKPGAQRTAAQLRAMLVASAPRGGDATATGPAPKRPEVLITTAATGEGVPELLAALDRHRAVGRRGGVVARRASPVPRPRSGRSSRSACASASTTPGARGRDRGDARRGRRAPLDPYAAADRLLERVSAADRPHRTGRDRASSRARSSSCGGGPRVLHRRRDRSSRSRRRFVEERLAGDTLARRHRVRVLRDRVARAPPGRRLVVGPLRAPAAARRRRAADRGRRWSCTSSPSTSGCSSCSRGRSSGWARRFFLVAALAAASDLAPPDRRGRGAQPRVALALPRARRRAVARRGRARRRRLRARLARGGGARRRRGRPRGSVTPRRRRWPSQAQPASRRGPPAPPGRPASRA